jgi:hypothetical protein
MDLKKLIKYSKEKQWREKNKERFRRYMREYMREYREKKKNKYIVKSTRKLQPKTIYFLKRQDCDITINFD